MGKNESFDPKGSQSGLQQTTMKKAEIRCCLSSSTVSMFAMDGRIERIADVGRFRLHTRIALFPDIFERVGACPFPKAKHGFFGAPGRPKRATFGLHSFGRLQVLTDKRTASSGW